MKSKSALGKYQDIFRSGGYLHPTIPRINDIVEGESEQEMPNYVTHGFKVQNWITIYVPSCIHISKSFVFCLSFQKSFTFPKVKVMMLYGHVCCFDF